MGNVVWSCLPYFINALEVDYGIASGFDGEHWVIADDIFRRTYEEVKQ